MGHVNQGTIQGRLTKDPTASFGGTSTMVNITLASEDNYSKDKTNWIRCTAWGRTAEFLQKWFKKGDMVICTYHLTSFKPKDSAYETMGIVIDSAHFAGSKREKSPDENQADEFIYREEDLPF